MMVNGQKRNLWFMHDCLVKIIRKKDDYKWLVCVMKNIMKTNCCDTSI
jgi:hypothetical protein